MFFSGPVCLKMNPWLHVGLKLNPNTNRFIACESFQRLGDECEV